jgi:phosphoglycolate phosphatase
MKYKAIIYDLDGTLIDTKLDIALSTNETLRYMGEQPLESEEIHHYVGAGVKDLMMNSLKTQDQNAIDEATHFFNNHYLAHCLDNTRPYEGVEEVLRSVFASDIKQAVLTNKPQNFTDKIITGLKWTRYFDVILGAESGFPLKPDKKGVEHIIKILKVISQDVLIVGDSPVDLQTAQSVRADCLLVTFGYTPRQKVLSYKDNLVGVCDRFKDCLASIKP